MSEYMYQNRILLLVVIITMLLGCFSARTVADESVKIMPLGDSITRGWWGSPCSHGYRKPLYDNLKAAGHSFDFVGSQTDGNFPDPNHEGYDGWHADTTGTNDILGQVYNWLTTHPADIVLLHIGTNDITYNGQNVNEINAILNEIDRFSTDIKVILALIINRTDNATKIQTTTQFNIAVNNMAQNRIATGDDIIIVNMENAINYTTDMADSLHPNDNGYAKMANVWFNALVNILKPPSITSIPISNVVVFEQYSYDVNADGYPQPTYELVTYPEGMMIDHNTGQIEWLPTATGDFDVTVKTSNGQMPDANQSFVITVEDEIEFDAASSNFNSFDDNTLSWQHTIADGNNRILIVGIAGEDDDVNDLTISRITYNDVNMSLVEGSSEIASSGSPISHTKTELYYLLDANLPSLPGAYTVTVTYNGNVEKRCGSAISLANVDQQSREAVATNSNIDQNTISTNITTKTDDAWIVDIVGCGSSGSFLALTDGMTERFDVNSNSSTAAGSTKPVGSARETTMSWTHSGANRLTHSVAAFAPAPRIIAGYISEPNNTPIEDVSVLADVNGSSNTTDANGYYELLVPHGWSGTIMPTKDGYLFAPSERTYSKVTVDLSEQNYKDLRMYDLDNNELINWSDVEVMCENWLVTGPDVPGDIHKDEDNIVNFLDFADFAAAW
jgi:lysophospholipase L1-like esterase